MNFFKWFKPKQKVAMENRVDFSKLLISMQKTSIRISYDEEFKGECPIGISKLGGKPDLPPDFQWYYFQGKSYEETIANLPPTIHQYYNRNDIKYNAALPLSFLAQINLAEVHEYDKENLLPSTGMLYFFYEFATMTWGDLGDKGGSRVYYYSGNISELHRTDFPSDLQDEFKIPEIPITFSNKTELPDYEEFIEWYDEYNFDQWNKYDETRIEMNINSEYSIEEDLKINKLLGYANLIQSGMLLECEAATSGIILYSDKGGYSNNLSMDRLRQLKENCKKWQLLFQLESIYIKNYEMLWGDCGRIYFYINSDDLKKQNFENCWLVLQCT